MAEWKERYLELWNNYSKRQRYMIIGAAALVFIAIVAGSIIYGGKPDMVPLFTNMEAKDAGEVAAKLKENKVNYEIQESGQGTTILVPAKSVDSTRLDLAAEGLPRGNKGFELFDDSKLGVTEFQNKVNYLQALQGELTRTIEQIDAVEKARVHIVLPEDSLYKKNEKPATASIMLKLKTNMQLSKKEVKGIVNLAAHSVQGLTPENITIVDESGKILNDPDENNDDGVGQKTLTQMEMTKKVQDNLQKNVQSLLDASLGEGKSFVRISVELDFDQKTTDSQTYTPVVDESGIVRSQQTTSESYAGTSTQPGGPAGTQSNVPGYVEQNNNSQAQYERKENTTNYEVNEEKRKIVASPGSIRRLTVAVLVNDDVTQAQQESILRSVRSAAGINPDRGDTVSVEPLPFSTEARDKKLADEQAERDRLDREFYLQLAAFLLVIALIVGSILMYRRKKRLEQEAIEEQRRQEELERQRLAEERAAQIEAGEVTEEELTEEEQRQLNEMQAIEEMIMHTPEDAAMLVKQWLAGDD